MIKNYPEHFQALSGLIKELQSVAPATMSAFGEIHFSAISDGALDAKTKELIALGIAICVRCDGCIAYHVHDAIEAGAQREEIIEAIGVAVLMGGGPSVVYGSEALEALNQFEAVAEV
jgi:AhpD family alkylhydroperoxidase